MLPVGKLEPNRGQPRKNFDPEALQELTESIRLHGMITPITVRSTEGGYYQIIAGERRWRAARQAGLTEIPAYVLRADDQTVMELALIENLQRQDLNPMEEAEGYQTLMEEFGLTQEETAERVGKSRSAVANSLRLLGLNAEVRNMLAEGRLSSGHARAVLAVKDTAKQTLAARTMADRGMSVRQAESYVKRLNKTNIQDKMDLKVDYYKELEQEIEAVLGRRVTIAPGKNKGVLELEFYGNEDLERLTGALKLLNI